MEHVFYYYSSVHEAGVEHVTLSLNRRTKGAVIVPSEGWERLRKDLTTGGYKLIRIRPENPPRDASRRPATEFSR